MLSLELARLQAWGVLPPTDATTAAAEPELQDVAGWAASQPRPNQDALLAALPYLLPALHPAKAAAVLALAGSLVEGGADPELLLPAALQHLYRLQARYEAGEDVTEETWQFTVLGLMAMLTRSASNRAKLRAQPELLTWLSEHEDLSDYFQYLAHMAEVSDEDALWVVFPAYGTGLEVAVAQVNNTFHLLTLLQPVVREQAAALRLQRPPTSTDPAVLAYAQGQTYNEPAEPDYARLEWLTADAYTGPGRDLHHGSIAWGEAAVSVLPRLRGHVLLLATDNENRMQRSWDAGFLTSVHDANQARVSLRRLLPPAEVQALLAELAGWAPETRTWPALPAGPAVPDAAPPARPGFWRRLLGGR